MYYSPSAISWKNNHFLIMSAPDNSSMKRCIQDLKSYNVKHLTRSCEQTYDESQLIEVGINVSEIIFDDGKVPDEKMIAHWFNMVDDFFGKYSDDNA